MLKTNLKNVLYRRYQAPISKGRQAIIDEDARECIQLDEAIKNLEHRFENRDQLVKNSSNTLLSPVLTENVKQALSQLYRLSKNYDAEIRTLVTEDD